MKPFPPKVLLGGVLGTLQNLQYSAVSQTPILTEKACLRFAGARSNLAEMNYHIVHTCRVSGQSLSGGGGRRPINGRGRVPKGGAGRSLCGGGSRRGGCRKRLSRRTRPGLRLDTLSSSGRRPKEGLGGATGSRTSLLVSPLRYPWKYLESRREVLPS